MIRVSVMSYLNLRHSRPIEDCNREFFSVFCASMDSVQQRFIEQE